MRVSEEPGALIGFFDTILLYITPIEKVEPKGVKTMRALRRREAVRMTDLS